MGRWRVLANQGLISDGFSPPPPSKFSSFWLPGRQSWKEAIPQYLQYLPVQGGIQVTRRVILDVQPYHLSVTE